MKKTSPTQSGFSKQRLLLGLAFCLISGFLALLAFTGVPTALVKSTEESTEGFPRYMPVPGEKADDLARIEMSWNDRLTYPTGRFDPEWVRQAAAQDALIARELPLGIKVEDLRDSNGAPLVLNPNAFTALGPAPERMTGCSGCFDYGLTQGRVNAIVIDPTTTSNGSIVAYIGTIGGGVWKTTNCCSGSTSWTMLTDDPLISTTAIDTLAMDPNNHNVVYAGTGDLNFGSFSMGSQGILKTTDGGTTWTVLGASVFGAAYTEPPGQYPQYNAVGKVRVDPNNSSRVVAGTKKGLYFSYNGGVNWSGPCLTNAATSQRQDITGLELSNMGGGVTRILAAIGTRGFATPVQYDLGLQGANGVYAGTMAVSGCPTNFASITTNANGWTGTNATSGTPFGGAGVGNQLGRIDLAVAPSNSNYIYAQVGAITPNQGGQLAAWRTIDGGVSWTQVPGSTPGTLRNCTNGAGDYPQNWYDQAIGIDPNNPDRVFFSTFDVWFWQNGNAAWNDTSCGYSGGNIVHVDQHALAFVPGSSSILIAGNDGGVHGTITANLAGVATDPTWFNMDTGLNTIEFYAGDISGNFATSATPQAVGGAQDNGPSSVTFSGTPTGPVQWQMGLGGDGFSGQIDPIGTGTSLRVWQGNNSGGLSRCISNCTNPGASYVSSRGSWTGDQQSFVLPINLFHGGIPGGDDCGPAGATTGCGHLIAGTTRVWETIRGAEATVPTTAWYVTNDASCTGGTNPCLTKGTLGNRSYINQVKYSPKYQSVAIVGTNDGNVQIGFNLGTGLANQGIWVNVTGSNTVLPNRPILGIGLDPSVSTANLPVGYAAVGGFNANTPTTPGHVFQVTCTAANCASFTWLNKTGNLPDIPVDSIINNPNYPQQVFAGTDIGLYYTNDITAASPVWYRFSAGLPAVMIWDMQIDRGSTTLSLWTRGRGAFAWPLPLGPANTPPQLTSVVSRKTHAGSTTDVGSGPYNIDLGLNGIGIECRSGGANGNFTVVFTFANTLTSVASAAVTGGTGSVSSSNIGTNTREYIVNLTGVTNAQHIAVTLNTVQDSAGNLSPAMVGGLNVLRGDTNGDSFVNTGDAVQTRSRSGQALSGANFRSDVNFDGSINSGDTIIVRGASGTSLTP